MRRTRLSSKRSAAVSNKNNKDEQNITCAITSSSPQSAKKLKTQKHIPQRKNEKQKSTEDTGSSSDSDLESYLQPADKIDLNSSFFQNDKQENPFQAIENNIFDGINKLSDSESENEAMEEVKILPSSQNEQKGKERKLAEPKINFQQLHDYTKKLEEAKQLIEKYKAGKRANEDTKIKTHLKDDPDDNILNLLSKGEGKSDSASSKLQDSVKSSDFESYSESEKEDWEEVHVEETKNIIPKEGVQITVELPGTLKKKKGIDLIAAMKRRLNRIKKENQVYIHKVHLLCWLAHGNYVNKTLNDENLLGLALSLIPSQHCYPSDRTDLKYLEQIVKWYGNTMELKEKPINKSMSLEATLTLQMNRKLAFNKKMFVYIFICILRSLGIQCRLVLSFQVAPLRPPASELHSLSTKPELEKKEKPKSDELKSENERKQSDTNINARTDSKKLVTVKKSVTKNVETKIKNGTQEIKKVKNKSELKTVKPKEETTNTVSKSASKGTKAKVDKKNENVELEITKKSGRINLGNLRPENAKSKQDKQDAKHTKGTSVKEKLNTKARKQTADDKKNAKSVFEADEEQKNKDPNENTKTVDTDKKISKKTKETNKKKPLKATKTQSKIQPSNNNIQELRNAIPQLDGANDSDDSKPNKKTRKVNLKKLTQEPPESQCPNKAKHSRRLKSLPNYTEKDSDEDFKSDDERKTKIYVKTKSDEDSPLKTTKKKKNIRISDANLKTQRESTARKIHKTNLKQDSSTEGSPIKTSPSHLKKPVHKSSFFDGPSTSSSVVGDIISIMKNRMAEERTSERQRLVKTRKVKKTESDYDSDYAPEPIKKKQQDSDDEFHERNKVKVKQRVKVNGEKNEEELKKEKKGEDVWVEVFLESEGKWISADLFKGGIHVVTKLYQRASHPVTYIVAWNNDNSIKDITQRYCPNWNTVTRKLRVNKPWWEATLKPFTGRKTARDKEEDEELARLQLEKPLPTTITEYKNHPLYVLKRHLLKFEAIYPPDCVTLGFVRKEPVYSRDCVHTLHSREIWLKHAKVVKPGEKPYKIVKARPKYDRLSGQVVTDLPLEIFGVWQVGDYVPPTAQDGIVPRNAYGNVELFKTCMLPKGTVHLQLPGLNKVAKKMNIDCAPAVVGFDFHSGWSHPTFDGFVVCEEHSESLVAAWYMEQEEQEKRDREKIEKRVYDNWKKLIKGLLIRERLKARYDYGNPSNAQTAGKKRKNKGPRVVSKKRRVYSDNESNSSDNV